MEHGQNAAGSGAAGSAFSVCVVGGGAAGLLAAAAAASAGACVTVLEKNERAGRKLRITGKGRCNVTCAADPAAMQEKIVRGARFLRTALYAFPPSETVRFFEAAGVPLKEERGGRIFPVSDNAHDVADALLREAKAAGASVRRGNVTAVEKTADGFLVRCGREALAFDRVILATGGASYPGTGSTGDGYGFARALGHRINEPQPSLIPLITEGDLAGRLAGLSLKNAAITVKDGKKIVYRAFGELLFTHFGLSGPIVLSASARMDLAPGRTHSLFIDLKPALDRETLDRRILRDLGESANRDLVNAVSGLYPRKLILPLLEEAGLDPRKKANEVTRAERARLLEITKALPFTVTGARPLAEAIVTRGGAELSEVDPRTMESRIVPGLYFAGEILDADAETGGFNLQIAWATGRLAGLSAAR
ncbi:MAG: NAD(P)/FAD-dependent oxidoreductase [Clostridia bacterium]|nr:NAD(P)/FAD-dependent oxidoreductase [Clostridia bacterium]